MLKHNSLNVIDALDLLQLLPDESVDLVFTDPPYNISQKNQIYRDYRSGTAGDISFDFGSWDYGFDPIHFLEETKRVLNSDGSLIVWTSEQLYGTYRNWCFEHMRPRQTMIWIKSNPLPQFRKTGYRQATELMFWATKDTLRKNNPNFIFRSQQEMVNYFYAPIVGGKERIKIQGKSHPTQKPLSICRRIIQTHCKPNGLVVDPYCGVGSIPKAAQLEGRNYIGGDIDETYIEAANQRLGG